MIHDASVIHVGGIVVTVLGEDQDVAKVSLLIYRGRAGS